MDVLGKTAPCVPFEERADEVHQGESEAHVSEGPENAGTELPTETGPQPPDEGGGGPDMEAHATGQQCPNLVDIELPPVNIVGQDEVLGHGHRKKEVSVRLRDYVPNTTRKLSPSAHSTAT